MTGHDVRRTLRAVLPLVLFVALSAACQVLGPGRGQSAGETYPDLQTLESDPAAALVMPGAEKLSPVGGDRRKTVDGEFSAFTGAIWGTQASHEQVRAFYDAELRRLGMTPDTYETYESTTDLAAYGWCQPTRRFRLGIIDPVRGASPQLTNGRQYATVFDATLLGRRADVACPYTG